MMNVRIEKMSEEHIVPLAAIEKQCFSTPWSENALREELHNPNGRFFVCVKDDVACGYIGAHNVLGEVYITNVAVSPDYRKQGLGALLVGFLKEYTKDEKGLFVTLEVRKSNAPARNLYSKMGFRAVGERKNFYENPKEDAILMTYTCTDGEV